MWWARLGCCSGFTTAGTVIYKAAGALHGRERTAWRLVGTGLLIGSIGVLAVATIDIVTGAAPAFGPTDLFFVTAYLLVLTGFGSLPHLRGNLVHRLRVSLDGLIGAVSIAALLWAFVLNDIIAGLSDAPAWQHWMGITYPILDVAAMIAVMVVVVRRSTYRFDPRLLIFALGMIAQAAGDLTFLVSGVGKTFDEASPFYPLFLFAVSAYLVTGLLLDGGPPAREYAQRRTQWWTMAVPYSAAAVMVAVVVTQLGRTDLSATDAGLLLGTLAVGGLVVARQAVAIKENRQKVERQQDALVSSISHELRHAAHLDRRFHEPARRGAPPRSLRKREDLLQIVHQQALYMARIVDDLMMLARSDPESLELKTDRVMVRSVIDAALRSVEGAHPSFDVRCQPRLGAIVDRDRTLQVLSNLISNAVRYGGDHQLIVAKADNGDLVFEVHDNGEGVPKKHELIIWERFERGHNRLNSMVPGSGIGLAIVDVIARAYNGEAGYRTSELLGGACFWVRLPGRVAAYEAFDSSPQSVALDELGPLDSTPLGNPARSHIEGSS